MPRPRLEFDQFAKDLGPHGNTQRIEEYMRIDPVSFFEHGLRWVRLHGSTQVDQARFLSASFERIISDTDPNTAWTREPQAQPGRIAAICEFFANPVIADDVTLENLGRAFAKIHAFEIGSGYDANFVTEKLFLADRELWKLNPTAVSLSLYTLKSLMERNYFAPPRDHLGRFVYGVLCHILGFNMDRLSCPAFECLRLFVNRFKRHMCDAYYLENTAKVVLPLAGPESNPPVTKYAISVLTTLCCLPDYYGRLKDGTMRAIFTVLKSGLRLSQVRSTVAKFWTKMSNLEKGRRDGKNFVLGAIPIIVPELIDGLFQFSSDGDEGPILKCLGALAAVEPEPLMLNGQQYGYLADAFRTRISATMPERQRSAFLILKVIAKMPRAELVRPFLGQREVYEALGLAPHRAALVASGEPPAPLPPPWLADSVLSDSTLADSVYSGYLALFRGYSDFFCFEDILETVVFHRRSEFSILAKCMKLLRRAVCRFEPEPYFERVIELLRSFFVLNWQESDTFAAEFLLAFQAVIALPHPSKNGILRDLIPDLLTKLHFDDSFSQNVADLTLFLIAIVRTLGPEIRDSVASIVDALTTPHPTVIALTDKCGNLCDVLSLFGAIIEFDIVAHVPAIIKLLLETHRGDHNEVSRTAEVFGALFSLRPELPTDDQMRLIFHLLVEDFSLPAILPISYLPIMRTLAVILSWANWCVCKLWESVRPGVMDVVTAKLAAHDEQLQSQLVEGLLVCYVALFETADDDSAELLRAECFHAMRILRLIHHKRFFQSNLLALIIRLLFALVCALGVAALPGLSPVLLTDFLTETERLGDPTIISAARQLAFIVPP